MNIGIDIDGVITEPIFEFYGRFDEQNTGYFYNSLYSESIFEYKNITIKHNHKLLPFSTEILSLFDKNRVPPDNCFYHIRVLDNMGGYSPEYNEPGS